MSLLHRDKFASASDERGIVVPLFAAFSTLLVLLLLGWCIDLPTHQAAVVRNQFSVDIGNATGLIKFWDPAVIADAANTTSAAANYGTYNDSPGIFFNQVPQSVIGIPETSFSTGGELSGGFCENRVGATPSCDTGPTGIENMLAFKNTADPYFGSTKTFLDLSKQFFNPGNGSPVVDFRNGIVLYNYLKPFSYFSFLSSSQQTVSTVSSVRLVGTMSGILVDPTFSMNFPDASVDPGVASTLFQQIFSRKPDLDVPDDENTDTFPLAAYRKVPVLSFPDQRATLTPKDVTYPTLYPDDPSSEWNSSGYWVMNNPGGYVDLPFSVDPSGNVSLSGDFPSIFHNAYNFFSASCDSLPFFFFKSAAVNLIDRFARSSAFSPTTLVGVSGYEPRDSTALLADGVVPIFPSYLPASASPYESFEPPTAYPLQINSTSGDIYLHRKKSTAFRGWVRPDRFSNLSNPADPDSSPISVELRSRPELLYCSEYYRSARDLTLVDPDVTGPILPEDFMFNATDSIGFHHATVDTQRRSSPAESGFGSHWFDDVFATGDATELGLHHSGTNSAGDGETPRNFVGGLALRLKKYNFQSLDKSIGDPATWVRPDPTTDPTGDISGFSYLPYAINSMCNQIKAAANQYNQDSTIGKFRPVQQTALIVFASQLYSQEAFTYLNNAGIVGSQAEALANFRTALESCLCNSPEMKVIFAMLPMDVVSSDHIELMKNEIYLFEEAHNQQCVGTQINICGSGVPVGSVFSLVYDWKSSPKYGNYSASLHDDALSKIAAARAFFTEVPETITKLLMQWVYAG